jgi:hypothetical protein
MFWELANISIIFSSFCLIDRALSRFTKLDGIYYLLHFLHNGVIVYLTGNEVINSLADFSYILTSPKNILALEFVFALHLYHLAIYYPKFRMDDWLHHILMVGIALPIGWIVESRSLLGYSLFFTTGLPGGIDYLLLFLHRNNMVSRNIEKSINAWLNTWIRSPGCISHATLTLAFTSLQSIKFSLEWWGAVLVAFLTFWNGQYFMRQVVENNSLFINWQKQHQV